MTIKELSEPDKIDAMNLVWSVFLEFEAPDYEEGGIRTFNNFINDESVIHGLLMYGAYEQKNLVGVIATRNEGNHISLFFVHSKYHRQGIGRRLFEVAVKNSTSEIITVNSSPYAVAVYHKLGFIDTGAEQTQDGMRFTPMRYQK